MTDTKVHHPGSFHLDEDYISSEMSPAARSRKNSRSVHNAYVQNEATNLGQLNESLMQQLNSLHLDRDNLIAKVDQLEDELRTMDLKNEALVHENKRLDEGIKAASFQLSEFQHMADHLESRKYLLENQNDSLLQKKQKLELYLEKNDHEMLSVLQKANDLEQAMAAGIRRIERITRELEQLTLQETSDGLEDDSKKNRRTVTKDVLEDELTRLSNAVTVTKQELTAASNIIEKLRREADFIKSQNKKLENALASAQSQCAELESQEMGLATKLTKLNHEVRTLSGEDIVSDSELSSPSPPGLDSSQATAQRIERDYIALRNSIWKVLEVIKEKQLHISRLESQLFAAGDSKKALEIQMKKLSATSSEASKQAREEVATMKQQITELTEALESSESKVLQLQLEVDSARRRLRAREITATQHLSLALAMVRNDLREYRVPLIAASASLAAVGIYISFCRK